jgi:hypothetical protein
MMKRACLALILLLIVAALPSAAVPMIVIRNNYDMPYAGPVTFKTSLPGGLYSGGGYVDVSSGEALGFVNLGAHSEVRLLAERTMQSAYGDLLSAEPTVGGLDLAAKGATAHMDLGLVVLPGRTGTATVAVSSYHPLDLSFDTRHGYPLKGKCRSGEYEVEISAMPYGEGFVDINATVTRVEGDSRDAYVALVRRISTPGVTNCRMRWNGKVVDGEVEPTQYEGSWGLNHCVDWFSWRSGELSFLNSNGFTPGLTTETSPGRWQNAGHTYVWEHARKKSDGLYFISEIAGPDPSQKPGYKGIKAYMPPLKGEPVKLHYRLAIARSPGPSWQESQFLVSSGYRKVTNEAGKTIVDLGVPYVEFGTSYFPYSTMTENFDFYRTPGLDREGWWPFSPVMWEKWREFAPQMRTDLRIIRAMGFEWVRMHHLELIASMDRANAMAFIDFYMNECRKLGLKVLIDTEGTPQWFTTLAGRYKDVVKRIEIENEVLIPGIKPGDAERWKACYAAAKSAAPDTDVFLTGSANLGVFNRLDALGVPYDRLGYHSYKHGPGADETLSSLAVGVAGVAADRGKTPILSEFNWKFLTRMSPEARAKEWSLIFGDLLKPQAVPELLQFHWQETMSVNPLLTRVGIRHYETIYLDRRPKPEAFELMKLIRQYCRKDAPIRELPIHVENVDLTYSTTGKAHTQFTVTNSTAKAVTVKLTPESFGGTTCRLTSASSVVLKPGKSAKGTVEVNLKPNALPGVYHFFVKAVYSGKASYGWGYATNVRVPRLDSTPVLPDLVDYPDSVADAAPTWSRAECVAFGPDAPIVEMEMAYVVANTLQSATGRAIRLCSTADIPAKMLGTGVIILVGTPESNPLIKAQSRMLNLQAGKGAVRMDAGSRLLLTGDSSKAVEAAATEFVLRYWKHAKDSAIRITGMEKGAALGNRAAPGQINPP